jgi:hypothetical protein
MYETMSLSIWVWYYVMYLGLVWPCETMLLWLCMRHLEFESWEYDELISISPVSRRRVFRIFKYEKRKWEQSSEVFGSNNGVIHHLLGLHFFFVDYSPPYPTQSIMISIDIRNEAIYPAKFYSIKTHDESSHLEWDGSFWIISFIIMRSFLSLCTPSRQ